VKCFMRLWRILFKPDSGFPMAFTFQGRSSVSWRWRTFRATEHQQNDRECWKNSRTHPRRPSPNNPWARRHRWDQLGCVSTCATTQLEACQYARRRSNDQTETCTSSRSRSESGRHSLPFVYPVRTHFAHASPLAYCCPYACVVAQVETQPYGVNQQILSENLNMRCIAAKFVPRLLTN
jgi:hypothetical protein